MPAHFRFLILVLAVSLQSARCEIPGSGTEFPGGILARHEPAWSLSLTTQAMVNPALKPWVEGTNTQGTTRHSITTPYLQKAYLNLSAAHLWNQKLLLQLPLHYTFWIAENLGYADGVTLGDMRLLVQSHVLQTGPLAWHTLLGAVLPTATQSDLAYGLTDLEGLPRNRRVVDEQGLSGGRGMRALVGLRTEWPFMLGNLPIVPWSLQVNVRQPLQPKANSPFTLIDVKTEASVAFSEKLFAQLVAGQTRAWLPLSLFEAAAPSATFIQAALGWRWQPAWAATLGLRVNPLHGEEAEPYRVVRREAGVVEPDLAIRFAAEPAWQITAALVFEGRVPGQVKPEIETVRAARPHSSPAAEPGPPRRAGGGMMVGREGDRDGDGLADGEDRCPEIPEDLDGYRDQDGCPDSDNDRDGRPDTADLCPNDAEDHDGYHDQDGCPDLDNDGDGIPDAHDKCPREREIVNFYQDADGCPDEKPARIARNDLQGVTFAHNQESLDETADSLINLLAEKLSVYKGTSLIVYGHSDPTESNGKALGLARAKAVTEALKKRGIAAERLSLVSMAASEPIANNRSAKGRAQNRRVTLEPK